MFFSSIKQINQLISKGMSNIYLRVTNEKKWCTQKFYFLSSKSSSLGQYPTHTDTAEFANFLLQIEKQSSGSKLCMAFLLI